MLYSEITKEQIILAYENYQIDDFSNQKALPSEQRALVDVVLKDYDFVVDGYAENAKESERRAIYDKLYQRGCVSFAEMYAGYAVNHKPALYTNPDLKYYLIIAIKPKPTYLKD